MLRRIALLLLLIGPKFVLGQSPLTTPPSVFEVPERLTTFHRLQTEVRQLLGEGKLPEAEAKAHEAVILVPFHPQGYFHLACVLTRREKAKEALATLDRAVLMGFAAPDLLRTDPELGFLRDHHSAELAAIEERATKLAKDPHLTEEGLAARWKFKVEPAPIVKGVALVSEANAQWDESISLFRPQFQFDDKPNASVLAAGKGLGEAGNLVHGWYSQGTAAGNHGDLYDNRDTDHSNLDYAAFPQLARVEYDEAAKKRGLHHGLQNAFLFSQPLIGNSSTALVSSAFWRSQPRFALTQANGPSLLYRQYTSNQIYFYPEHVDHDALLKGTNDLGHGDLFPANTPYMVISQGSSGSDQPFLKAFAITLAAFKPAVKRELARQGLLAPTLQLIFRMSNRTYEKPEDYFSGRAHPTVFEASQIDMVRMVKHAQAMTLERLPPLARIEITSEEEPVLGVDYCDSRPREKLFDTPCAVARVMKSLKNERRFVVSAKESRDLLNRPLTFQWIVLRGDAERIRIKPLNEAGSEAEIVIPYHERGPISPDNPLEGQRVDIGLFASNEDYPSAPAILSFTYLGREKRVYDKQGRIASVDYADPEFAKRYDDPAFEVPRDWRDEFQYDAAGNSIGWTRIRGQRRERFTRDGALVIKADALDRPIEAKRVLYRDKDIGGGRAILEQIVTNETLKYRYADAKDRVGKTIAP